MFLALVRPRTEISEEPGTAVEKILTHASKGINAHHLPVYFGDAENDREAMEKTNLAGGVAIGVGPHAPAVARVRLVDTGELATRLSEFVASLEEAAANRIHPNSNNSNR